MDDTSSLANLFFDRRTALHTLAGASVLAGTATVLSTSPAHAADALPSGATLGGNQRITSPNGAYRLVMQTNGDLVLYKGTAALWWTGTIKNGVKAVMQADGNLLVRRSDNSASWSSKTNGFNGSVLKVKNDGNLVMYQNGLPTWSRHHGGIVFHQMRGGWTMRAGQIRLSTDRRFRLVMQTDGNLVLYRVGAGAMWASGTRGTNHRAAMQSDGNFVIYNASNNAVWSTRTAGRSGAALLLQNDGNLVLKAGTSVVWSTNTVWTALAPKVDAFVSTYQGRYVDFDKAYGPQCVDLFNFYNRDIVKAPRIGVTYAWELWDKAPSSKYTRISASSTPRKGDVAIWSKSLSVTGHVAMALWKPTPTTVRVFGQNWPSDLRSRSVDISTTHLRGYLRPIV